MNRLLTTLVAIAMATLTHAAIWMPAIFGDGMVLQRNTQAKIWGTAKANATITITASWAAKAVTTKADSHGRWSAAITTTDANSTPQKLTVKEGAAAKPSSTVTFENVLIGEVWLCAGQSNMEMPMKGFPSQPIEGGTMDILHSRDSQLHIFTAKRTSRVAPIDTVTGSWKESMPESIREFSATAYYFGRELRQSLGVPVGLIVTSWGGSSCESWMDREHVQQFVHANSPYQIPNTAADIKSPNRTPTVLYNGMLHPIIGYGIKGAIWYQGEDNVPRYQDYAQQMQTMVSLWREKWGVGEFPFYYCQIAPYDYSIIGWTTNSALLREQQLIAERQIPNCGMAVLLDAGIKRGIHPPKKDLAGGRLALLALVKTYGTKGVTAESARFKSVEFKDSIAYIQFENDKMNVYSNDYDFASKCFEVAGADSIFHPAVMDLHKRTTIKVWSPEVKNPVAVRYAFRNWVQGDLFCDGLPLSSWRSDDWPVPEIQPGKTDDYDKR